MADWRTELQRILAALSDDASKGAIALMSRAVERLDRREALQFITEAFPEFISTYIAAAGDIGTTVYEDLPGGVDGFTAVTAALPAVEQLAANGRYMLLAPTTTVIQGVITRLVNGGVRDAQFANLAAEYGDPAILADPADSLGTLWARHASANACGFCRMLATRGAVYTSAEAATSVVGRGVDLTVSDQRAIAMGQMTRAEARERRSVYRNAAHAARQGAQVGDRRKSGRTRGIRPLGDKFHDHCHCIAVPVRPGSSYQPAPYVEQWQKDYEDARDAIPPGTDYRAVPKLISAAMDKTAAARTAAANPPKPVDPLQDVRRTAGRDLVADLAAINPKWMSGRQWQVNCTRCAAAVELRARGYDVTAEPRPDAVRDNGYASVLSRWTSPDGTPAGQGGGLHATRATVPDGEVLGMSTGSRIWDFLPARGRGKVNQAKRAADEAVSQWGDGARGFITVEWSKAAGGGAHIFNVENRGGKIVYLDGQSNEIDASGHWDRIKTTGGSCRIVRTDDLTPTKRVMEWTSERTDDDRLLAERKAARLAKIAAQTSVPAPAGLDGLGQSPTKWPPIPHITYPKYTRVGEDGIATSTVFTGADGKPEPLPDLSKMPGHVLYGWRDDDPHPHQVGDRRGHRFDSERKLASLFPESWSDQKIVDAVRAAIEDPDRAMPPGPEGRTVRKVVDGVLIQVTWSKVNEVVLDSVEAYPVRGKGVAKIGRDGSRQPIDPKTRQGDKRFTEVRRNDR
uniref:Tox-PL domain-containing protein n=2 Tax=Mycolicibacterium mucogenicum DSM 44124 TaxID=1226753 RepID=A0A8H2JIU0_MYCMU